MWRESDGDFGWLPVLVIAVLMQACVAPQEPAISGKKQAASETPAPVSTLANVPPPVSILPATSTPIASPVTIILPTMEKVEFRITATNGNLAILRGPGLAYNSVGALMEGESAIALARDVAAEWVEIAVPSKPGRTGWISLQTEYSVIHGNVMGLPAKVMTDKAVPAYVRNCTKHAMVIQPGDILIPSAVSSPGNEVALNPGIYVAHDLDMMMNAFTAVMDIDLSEGQTVEIRVDGNGLYRKCP